MVCVRYQVSNFLILTETSARSRQMWRLLWGSLGSLWCDKYSDDLKSVAVAAWNRLRSLTNAVCSTSQRQRPGSCESVVCSRRAGCCRRMKTRSCSRTAFILRAACKSNRVCSCKARQARGSYGCSYGSQSSQLKCCVFGAASAACTCIPL